MELGSAYTTRMYRFGFWGRDDWSVGAKFQLYLCLELVHINWLRDKATCSQSYYVGVVVFCLEPGDGNEACINEIGCNTLNQTYAV